MRKKRRTGPYPSSSAASRTSEGRAWRAASTITNVRPAFCHTAVVEIATSAEPGCLMLSQLTLRHSPASGWRSVKNTTDATATELATVEEKMVWKMRIPRSFRSAATARSTPRMMPIGTVRTANLAVTASDRRNVDDVSESMMFDPPIHSSEPPMKVLRLGR